MKTTSHSKKGFTLIELLAVIAIIGILGGLSFSAFARYQQKASTDKTQVQMQAIAAAIEEYRADHGNAPVGNNHLGGTGDEPPFNLADTTGDGSEQSSIGLLNALYPSNTNFKIYMPDLDPNNSGSSYDTDRELGIVDPFGFAYIYFSDGAYNASSRQRNPDYDIFSVGPDGIYNAGDPFNANQWQNRDNIYMR